MDNNIMLLRVLSDVVIDICPNVNVIKPDNVLKPMLSSFKCLSGAPYSFISVNYMNHIIVLRSCTAVAFHVNHLLLSGAGTNYF